MIATGERRHFRGEASPCVSGRRLRRRDRPASFRSLSEKTARREGTFNFRPPPISWAPPLDGRHESLFLDGLPLRRSCCYPPNLPLAGDPCAPYIISSLMHVTGTPRSLTRVNGLRVRPVSSTRSAGFLRDRGRSQIGGRADRDRRAGAPRSRLGISSNTSRRDAIGSKRYETQENRSNRGGGSLLPAAERRNPFRLHEKVGKDRKDREAARLWLPKNANDIEQDRSFVEVLQWTSRIGASLAVPKINSLLRAESLKGLQTSQLPRGSLVSALQSQPRTDILAWKTPGDRSPPTFADT